YFENDQKYIHIAGTKGKGAVSAITASILSAHGYRTGLFTSPHLLNIRERFRIDGKAISETDFIEEISILKTLVAQSERNLKKCYRTTFELMTALAFQYFAKMYPDWVVLETGMGGRLDCTNVVEPVITVITRIDKDHTDSLGNSLGLICKEKAGIAKAGIPLILGRQLPALYGVLKECVGQVGVIPETAYSSIPVSDIEYLPGGMRFSAKILGKWFRYLTMSLTGAYQLENCRTGLAIIQRMVLDGLLDFREEALRQGLHQVRWPGRFTVLKSDELNVDCQSCRFIIDGAHNPMAIKAVLSAIDTIYPGASLTVIVGIASNKDAKTMLEILHKSGARIVATTYESPRALTPDNLALLGEGVCDIVSVQSDLNTSLRWIEQKKISHEIVLITGSIYFAGEAMRMAGQEDSCLNIY
ncbi:hypothetical protein K8T06_05430, partial [bacterium]|nr:hypothetical protein [bacterium]